jgi:hypothetical protein
MRGGVRTERMRQLGACPRNPRKPRFRGDLLADLRLCRLHGSIIHDLPHGTCLPLPASIDWRKKPRRNIRGAAMSTIKRKATQPPAPKKRKDIRMARQSGKGLR